MSDRHFFRLGLALVGICGALFGAVAVGCVLSLLRQRYGVALGFAAYAVLMLVCVILSAGIVERQARQGRI